MTLSQQRAICSLTARASHTGTNTRGSAVIGDENTLEFPDANIAYSFKVTATDSGDVATLTLSTGVVAQTTGTPTITDGDGKDFEGVTLGTMATTYAVLVEFTNAEDEVTAQIYDGAAVIAQAFGDATQNPKLFVIYSSGRRVSSTTLKLTFGANPDTATVTVIGKTA